MAVALGKNDNAAAARDRPALRGLQAIVLPALRFLDRPTHAFKNALCQHDCLKARDISELFRGSLESCQLAKDHGIHKARTQWGKFLPTDSNTTHIADSQSTALLAQIPNAALAYDGNLDAFYLNELAAQWFGVEHSKSPIKCGDLHSEGTKLDEQFPLPSEATPWRRAWNGERVQGLQIVLTVAEQTPRFILCYSNGVANTDKSTAIVIISMIDISTIVRAAVEDAHSSQAYMQALNDSSSDVAIIATNTEGLVTVFNTCAEKLLGYSEKKVVGKLTPASFHVEEEVIARGRELSMEEGYGVAGFDVFGHAARLGKSETRKWTYVRKSGKHRKVSLFVSATRNHSSLVIGYLGMANNALVAPSGYSRKDGTRYPILAQGILMKDSFGRKVVWSLAENISERKRLDQIKNEFVSMVSHELRTPLTSITGALSLVVSGVLGEVNEEVRDMLKIAAKSSGRLSDLVNDLFDMDKLLAGKMELKVEQVD